MTMGNQNSKERRAASPFLNYALDEYKIDKEDVRAS